jgi:DNA-binding winged helix-turn-helix (wHTH) protein
MHDDAASCRRIRFDAFVLDVRSAELRKGTTRLRVPAQSIQILIALLEEPGQLVSRDELRRRLWDADTFVDFEQGLNTAVRRLREALGNSVDTPRFVETLPRRGYRFIGTTEQVLPAPRPAPLPAAENAQPELATLNATEPAAPAARVRLRIAFALGILAVAIAGAGAGAWRWHQQAARLEWARAVAPDEVSRLIDEQDYDGAFRVAERALAVDPDNAHLKQVWAGASRPASITSEPAGVEVFVRGYRSDNAGWVRLGRTPLENTRIPGGLLRFQLTGDGLQPFEGASHWGRRLHFTLVRTGTSPPGMVWVPEGIAGLIAGPAVSVKGFWVDRLEVTNREFKTFVDAGGYASPDYWTEPFMSHGRRLTWKEAVQQFTDTTGRPGPATWEVGTYPEGQTDYPVTGVSWYEAAAYLAFAGKSLAHGVSLAKGVRRRSIVRGHHSGQQLQPQRTCASGSPPRSRSIRHARHGWQCQGMVLERYGGPTADHGRPLE